MMRTPWAAGPLPALQVALALGWVGCGGAAPDKSTSDAPRDGTPGTSDSALPDSGDTAVVRADACDGRGTSISSLTGSGCVTEAACAWHGEFSYTYLGYSAHGGADFDGDGVEDIALGSIFDDTVRDGATAYDVGSATVLSGAALVAGGSGVLAELHGLTEGEQAGSSVAFVGDLDGDGDSELLIGARSAGVVGSESRGAAHLLLGGPEVGERAAHRTWTGAQTYGRAGHAVSSPGDLDGDGLPELAVAGDLWEAMGSEGTEVYSRGRVYLASGGDLPDSGTLATFPVQLEGVGAADQAGSSLAGGDLDGDGYVDLVVGAPYGSASRGEVTVVAGGAGAMAPRSAALDTEPLATFTGSVPGDAFGWSVGVGDVTGDGQADLVVGAPLHDAPWGAEGELTVRAGGAGFADGAVVARRTGEADDHQLGTGIGGGRDLDGDGLGDLVVGAVAAWHQLRPKSGRTYLLSGGPGLTGDHPIAGSRQLHALGAEDYLGRATALSDVDADGTADLFISSAYTNPDGRTDAGSAWLFFGG